MAKNIRRAQAIWQADLKRWHARVQVEGNRKSFYSSIEGKRGKTECEKKADAWLDANCPDNMRFGDAWSQYLAKVKAATGTGNYNNIEKYGRLYILPDLEKKKLNEVTLGNMDKCIEKVGQAGLSKRTCTNVRSAFVGFYGYCKKNNLPLVEPENLTIPTIAKVGSRRILQPEGLITLFSKSTYSYYGDDIEAFYVHAWRLIVVLGLRRGELCGLQQTDKTRGILHVQRSINNLGEETSGKNDNARRYIALPKIAIGILAEQQRMLKRHGIVSPWLFPDEHGDRLDSNHLYKMWRSYARTHGIKTSLHELRHTMVSIVKSDMPAPLLKAVVGHSESMDTFGVYGHEVNGDMERAAGIIDSVYEKILSPRS